MSARPIASVSWGRLHRKSALYGTELTVEIGDAVRLRNRLMPSGTVLQEWHSVTDYQSLRTTPRLPLLQQGRRYRIEPELASTPDSSVYFEVLCYDRFDELVHAEVLYSPGYAFGYPLECHHYTIRLRSGGCDELRFVSFTLWEEGSHE